MRVAVLLLALIGACLAHPHDHHHDKLWKPVALEHPKPSLNETDTKWVLFKQCNPKWATQKLGTCNLDLCQAGCAMSDVAMILATRGVSTNPSILNSWLDKNGGYADGCDIYWADVDKFGKTKFMGIEHATYAEICHGISQGHGIIGNVMHGEHWVLLTGCPSAGVFEVNDPGFDRSTYTMDDVIQEAVYHMVN